MQNKSCPKKSLASAPLATGRKPPSLCDASFPQTMLTLVCKVESTDHRSQPSVSAIGTDDMGLLNLGNSGSQERVRNQAEFRHLFISTGGVRDSTNWKTFPA